MMELFYNPERMSETEVKETFVANQWLVDEILSILRQQPKGAGVQHALIIAPRGMGKTTVLLMLRFSILESALAQSWQPVLFPEESYAVYDLADFWLSGLSHLASDTNDAGLKAKLSELQQAHPGDGELEEAALATIKDWRRETQKQLLMLVDSFDIILNQIGDERETARLRDVLMNDGTMMLVGGATTFFKEARDYDQPLYNLFKRYDLQTLSSDQIHDLLRRRAKLDAVENFDEILRRNASRIRVLEYFTGGNPRLVMMLYRVIMRSEVSEVRRGIEKLLDEVTPYYKAKVENLPPQQRKILDHIARISARTREGLTPTEIATSTRLPTNQVSSQLKRLADLGYVRAANVRGRSSYYTLSEPLYAIWHQMRFGREARERMNWLVSFLKGWYDTEELNSECARLQTSFHEYLAAGQLSEARDALEYRGYLMAALGQNVAHFDISNLTIDMYPKTLGAAVSIQEQLGSTDQFFEDARRIQSDENVALGRDALIKERIDDALRCFSRAIELNPSSLEAQFGLALTLTAAGNPNEALLALAAAERCVPPESRMVDALRALRSAVEKSFENVEANLNRIPASSSAPVWFLVGLLFFQSSEFDAALRSFSRVTELDPDYSEGWYWLASTYYTLGKNAEAVSTFDRALELDPGSAKAWHSRGLALIGLHRHGDALSSMERACELNPKSYDSLLGKSLIFASLGRLEDAKSSVGKVLKIDPTAFDPLYLRAIILILGKQAGNVIDVFKPAFQTDSKAHSFFRDTPQAHLIKFIISLAEQNIDEAKQDWIKLSTYPNHSPGEVRYHELAASILRDVSESGHVDFVRELIGDAGPGDAFFPLARALDYVSTGDDTLIEKLSPEVRKIVEEIVDTLEKSASRSSPSKRKERKAKRKRA